MEYISSIDNKLIKQLKKLKQKKYREELSLFIAEGDKFLDYPESAEYLIINENYNLNEEVEELIVKFNCRKIKLSTKVFNMLSSQENSQGVIIIYKILESNFNNLEDNIIVLDELRDPGNLGTIIRIVDAAGFKDIILLTGTVDAYNEKTIRSSMGSIFNVNIYNLGKEEFLSLIQEKNYKLKVTTLARDSVNYNEMNISEKNAFVFGNEGKGVSELLIDKSDEKVIIPIYGKAESLNVAVACAVFLYKVREKLKL